MSKQFKLLLITVNTLMGLLYLISSYVLWRELNNWYDYHMQSTWTPFYVYAHRIPEMSIVLMPVPSPMLNLPFITFLVTIITNAIIIATYYLIVPRLQKWATKNI